ncbi:MULTISPECIES: SH3 domain-containing protein [unclassified Streptomyces]|uniref:SH3 domain-containing protein n=1 Tax=unclassified Streptomyces TaxID=2593676 RepID=UPI00278C901A|nr:MULTISPECIES: SH3 domain-containing protein [unclassified Streptomyces]
MTLTTRLGIGLASVAALVTTAAVPAAGTGTPGADEPPPTYKGRVVAKSGLLLRDDPTRGAKVVRSEPYGATVTIFCKTKGDEVGGNSNWYLLTDGTWAWGSAKYIENVGAAPRWC